MLSSHTSQVAQLTGELKDSVITEANAFTKLPLCLLPNVTLARYDSDWSCCLFGLNHVQHVQSSMGQCPLVWRWSPIQVPQPDTSWSCRTTDTGPVCCLFTSQFLPVPIYMYTESKKGSYYTLVHIFAKYWPIFIILSPTYSVGNLQ